MNACCIEKKEKKVDDAIYIRDNNTLFMMLYLSLALIQHTKQRLI